MQTFLEGLLKFLWLSLFVIAVAGICAGKILWVVGPLIPLGYLYEDKFIDFEESFARKIKGMCKHGRR